MKIKTSLWAVCLLIGLSSLGSLNAKKFEYDGGGGGIPPVPRTIQIPPVLLELESGTINVLFTRDLGPVNLVVQDAAGNTVASREVEAFASQKETINLPAGTYTFSVTRATDGSVIIQTAVEIP